MVHAEKRHFGRGPTYAKSYLLDDLLLVVMRDGATTAERSAIELGHSDMVRHVREDLEGYLGEQIIPPMQELTGRTICAYRAEVLFDPFTVVAIFMFEK